MHSVRGIFLILALILLSGYGCSMVENEYSDFIDIPPRGWAYGDTLTFHPAVADSVADGIIKIAICHNNSYAYSDLWLEVSYPLDSSFTVHDTIRLALTDADGHWRGNGVGASFQYQATIPDTVSIYPEMPIHVRHIMRLDTLKGIDRIGIDFNKISYIDNSL